MGTQYSFKFSFKNQDFIESVKSSKTMLQRSALILLVLVNAIFSYPYADESRMPYAKRNWAFADLMTPDGSFNFDAKRDYFGSDPVFKPFGDTGNVGLGNVGLFGNVSPHWRSWVAIVPSESFRLIPCYLIL